MPGWVEDIEINEENVTGVEDFLKGNIFQKVDAKITVRFQTWADIFQDTNTDQRAYFKPPYMDGADPATNEWIDDYDQVGLFDYFNVGDTIVISSTSGSVNDDTMEIIEKPSRYLIKVGNFVSLPGLTSVLDIAGRIDLKQIPSGIIMDYGLIENDEGVNFNSKVSGDLMRYFAGSAAGFGYSTPVSLTPQGMRDWQLGIAALEVGSVKYIGNSEREGLYIYPFEVNISFLIHPFYLHTQLLDITTIPRTPPKYFDYQKALRLVFRLRALRDYQDWSIYQEALHAENDGRTGWFDELYNGGPNEYEVDETSLVYGNGIALTRDDVVSVEFDILNTADNIGGDPEYVCVNFNMMPEAELQYRKKDEYMAYNYGFDRANQQQGVAAINGVQFGTNGEVIKNLTVTSITGGVTVNFDVDFGTDVQDIIDSLNDKRYMITCYAVGPGMTSADANYNSMIVDIEKISIDIPDSTIVGTPELFFHDQNDFLDPVVTPEFCVEDEIVAHTEILLDQSSYDVQIEEFRGQIVMQKTGEDDVVLQEQVWDLQGSPEIGPVRFINSTIQTPFNVSASEIRKEYKVFRDTSRDSGSQYGYTIQHPFLLRWEYWEQLILANLPGDFLDTTEQHNGYNQNWMRLAGLSGWSFVYRLATNVVVGSTTKTINKDVPLVIADYLANPDWTLESITCLDGITTLTSGGQPYIYSKQAKLNTTIRAEFTYSGTPPDVADLWGLFRIIPTEAGTYIANETFSSEYNRESVSIFTSTNGKVTISNPSGNIIRLECEVDYSKLTPGISQYTISARLGQASSTLSWTPASITTDLWLDGQVGVTEAAGRVSDWADQSGNSYDAFQLTGSNQPELGAINSLQTIDFGVGTNYALEGVDIGTWTDIVVAGVFRASNLGGGSHLMFSVRDNSNNILTMGTVGSDFCASYYTGVTTAISTGITVSTDYYFVIEVVSGVPTMRVNAVAAAGSSAIGISGASDIYWLGSRLGTPTSEQYEGEVGEVVVVKGTITGSERWLLEDYFSTKYAI